MSGWKPPQRSFTTLQATVRTWGRHLRIAQLQGLGGNGCGDEGEERLIRVQIDAERKVHEEWDGDFVHNADSLDGATNWPLFDPNVLAGHPLTVLGELVVAGRVGVAMESVGVAGPAGMLTPGANRCVGVFDKERAVLLRVEYWLDDELLSVEELTEVEFDRPLACWCTTE